MFGAFETNERSVSLNEVTQRRMTNKAGRPTLSCFWVPSFNPNPNPTNPNAYPNPNL